jgi:hypothetical protein
MPIQLAHKRIKFLVYNIQNSYRDWDGDLIDLEDSDKDAVCYTFLLNMESWWDDMLPPVVTNQKEFLDSLYQSIEPDQTSIALRNAIYLDLESTLRDWVQGAYDELNNVKLEPFAGYGRGE